MNRAALLAFRALMFAPLAGCDTGPDILTGIGEPIRVSGAQFVQGSLPGTSGGSGESGANPPLSVTSVTFNSPTVLPGQAGKSFGGDVTQDAVAVGAALQGLGTGYWVVPTGPPDSSQPGSLTFGLNTSFDPNLSPGVRNLLVVGIGSSGQGGIQYPTPLCIESRIPDNGHACDSTKALPNTVFTLEWDTSFDLDLHVKSPSGVDYNPKQPYGGPVDAGIHGIPPGLPHIDHDSDGNCIPDGLNQEDLIFPDPPAPGKYTVYVDPYSSCGQPWAHFTFTLYRVSGTCPMCTQVATATFSGEVLASQETGGTLVPLLVAQVNL
jgi:hypothetical protein